jgi:hypothetical protein
MTDEDIRNLFAPLWIEFQGDNCFPKKRPLLAHYTSASVLESTLRNNEVWFSHPILMNDPQEVVFGLNAAARLFFASEELKAACGTADRFDRLKSAFALWFNKFAKEHLPNTFVLCFSEHEKEDNDGLLSMWRGYGDSGKGVAIVLDTARLIPRDDAFLILAKVRYGTEEQRIGWIQTLLARCAEILENNPVLDDNLVVCSFFIFQRLKLFAIFTKHRGFHEETEWRIVYMRDIEQSHLFNHMIGYSSGPRGLEPRLKLKMAVFAGLPETDNFGLSTLIERIILGPSSPPLAPSGCAKMVESLGYPELTERIKRSNIPYRT